jgi:crotonobetainyl-CoA:carnitine CoA-transferase CaiB-like acyl-CoA transferase
LHDDPQVIANDYLRTVESPGRPSVTLVASPVQFGGTPPDLTPAPAHGQNTEEVLLDIGLSWDEIAAHKKSGAIL